MRPYKVCIVTNLMWFYKRKHGSVFAPLSKYPAGVIVTQWMLSSDENSEISQLSCVGNGKERK